MTVIPLSAKAPRRAPSRPAGEAAAVAGAGARLEADALSAALKALSALPRLRIALLLAEEDLAVGELSGLLEMTQPGVSFHLNALAAAGLAERSPVGSQVLYGLTRAPGRRDLVDRVLALAERSGGTLSADRDALLALRAERAGRARARFTGLEQDWDALADRFCDVAAVAEAVRELGGPAARGPVVDLGTGTGRMLEAAGAGAARLDGLDINARMLARARDRLAAAGLKARLRQGDAAAAPYADGSAGLVLLVQLLHVCEAPGRVAAEAARIAGGPHGRIVCAHFAPHEEDALPGRSGLEPGEQDHWFGRAGWRPDGRLTLPPSADDGLAVHVTAYASHNNEAASA